MTLRLKTSALISSHVRNRLQIRCSMLTSVSHSMLIVLPGCSARPDDLGVGFKQTWVDMIPSVERVRLPASTLEHRGTVSGLGGSVVLIENEISLQYIFHTHN